ncbi:hypothetical protein F4678DRAFT_445212 [Xylaria arbuscula]|nr:hypothetical protein F4678DRAFT_445212 [Xylaria arbuscula]
MAKQTTAAVIFYFSAFSPCLARAKNHVTLCPGTGRNWANHPPQHLTLLLLDVDRPALSESKRHLPQLASRTFGLFQAEVTQGSQDAHSQIIHIITSMLSAKYYQHHTRATSYLASLPVPDTNVYVSSYTFVLEGLIHTNSTLRYQRSPVAPSNSRPF